MKTNIKSTIIKVLSLLFLSFSVTAQIDITYHIVSVSPSSTVLPMGQFSIDYTIENTGNSDSVGGIELAVFYNSANFTLNNATSSDSNWNTSGCNLSTGTVTCSYSGSLTGFPSPSTTNISLIFDVASSATFGNYDFDSVLSAVGEVPPQNGNNSYTQQITISNPNPPSASLVIQAADNLIVDEANIASGATMHFEIEVQNNNLSFNNGDFATFIVNFDDTDLIVDNMFPGLPTHWGCSESAGQISCNFSGSTGDVIPVNTTLMFDFNFTLSGSLGDTYSFNSQAYANSQSPFSTATSTLYLRPNVDLSTTVVMPATGISVNSNSDGTINFQFDISNNDLPPYNLPVGGALLTISSIPGIPFSIDQLLLPSGWVVQGAINSTNVNSVILTNSTTFNAGALASFTGVSNIITSPVGLQSNAISAGISFDSAIIDALDSTIGNNFSAFDVTVNSAPGLDMSLSLLTPNPATTSDIAIGNTNPTLFEIQLTNSPTSILIPAGGIKTEFTPLSDFTLENISAPNWTCDAMLICTNDIAMTISSNVIFSGSITSYATIESLHSGIVNVNVFDTSIFPNQLIAGLSDVNIPMIFAPDLDFVDAETSNSYPATFGQVAPVELHFQTIVTGNASANGASFSLPFDNTKFSYDTSMVASPQNGWSCTENTGTIQCVTTNVLLGGTTTDFDINFYVQNNSAVNAPVNTYTFTAILSSDTNLSNNSINTEIDISAIPQTEVTINTRATVSGNNDPTDITEAIINTQIIYVIGVDNTGGSTGANSENVTITNTLPPGVTFSSINGIGNYGTCGSGNFNSGTNTLTCTAISIPANATGFDGVEISVTVDGNIGDTITNNASVVFANDETPGTTTDSATFIITAPEVDLTITKASFDLANNPENTFENNDDFKYIIEAKNIAAENAPPGSVHIVDTLAAELTYITNLSTSDWNCSATMGNNISCTNINPVLSNNLLNLVLRVSGENTNTSPIDIDNTAIIAVIGNNVTEINTNNNSHSPVTVTINPLSNTGSLSMSKTVSGGDNNGTFDIDSGTDVVVYEIKVENTMNNDFNNLSVVDDFTLLSGFMDLDSAQVNISQGSISFTCSTLSVASPILTCNGDLAGNNTTTGNTSVFEANISLIPTNTTIGLNNFLNLLDSNGISLLQPAVVPINIIGSNQQAVIPIVTVLQAPDSVEAGSEFDIVIQVINSGPVELQNFNIINTLPSGFTYNFAAIKNKQLGVNGCNVNNSNASIANCSVASLTANGGSNTIAIPVTAITNPVTNTPYSNSTIVSGGNIPMPGNTVNTNIIITGGQILDLNYNIIMIDDIDPVEVDVPFNYKVEITNTGNLPINYIDFDTVIPSELTITSFSQPQDFVCSQSINTINCNSITGVFNLVTNEIKELLSISVKSTSFVGDVIASVNSTAGEENITTGIPINSINQHASEMTGIIGASTDLQIIKTASINEIGVGGVFDYTLLVINNSTSVTAIDIDVIDTLPSGVIMIGYTAPAWICNGKDTIVCSMSSLDKGSSSNIVLHVEAPPTIGTITNTASVLSSQPDDDLSNNNSQVSVTVNDAVINNADMSITKMASNASLTSGESLSWILKVNNSGPENAENIVVEDTMPEGFSYNDGDIVSDSGTNCQTANGILKCTIASMANGSEKTIVIPGEVTLDVGTLSNFALVTSANDPNTNNNTSSTVDVNVDSMPKADLSVDITIGSEILQGETTTFSIDVTNNGASIAQSPHVDLILSGIIETIAVTSGSWQCKSIDIPPAPNDTTVGSYNIGCDFNDATMPVNGNSPSNILLTTKTKRLVAIAENLVLAAHVESATIDSNQANNDTKVHLTVGDTPTEVEIEDALRTALDGTGNTQVNRAIQHVASYCEIRYFKALEGMCEDLYDAALGGETDVIRNIMEQITPNEVIGQSTSIAEIAQAQFRNIGSRLSALRSGGGSGFSSAGLNARYGNGSIPLDMLAYLNQTEDEVDGISSNSPDFVSPWGFFVNGTISMGERDATGRELEFDFDTFGLTAGIDYRLDAKKVVGIAIGYANYDSKIEETAELGSNAVTLTGYGSFYVTDNFYVDARISVAKPNFDQSRGIDFELGGVHIQRIALGETTADQYSIAMSVGYHFNKKSWNITPNASFRYIKTRIDGFTETGAGDFNFNYSGQEIESMVWSAGIRVSKAISLKNGVITPQFDFDYNYESLNDGNDIIARFIMAPVEEIFVIETDAPDRSYGSAGLGLVYVTSNGKQAYINYRTTIGIEGFSKGTFNLGARFEF